MTAFRSRGSRGRTPVALVPGALAIVLFGFASTPAAVRAQIDFQPAGTLTSGDNPLYPAAADFDGDGHLDLAVADFGAGPSYPGAVHIFLGDGAGGVVTGDVLAAGVNPLAIITADFDADGHADIAVASYGGASVTLLLGAGDGSFTTAGEYAAGGNPSALATGDFDEDGVLDLVVTNEASDTLSLLRGDGAGGFAPAQHYAVGTKPFAVAVRDFDGDGHLDAIVSNIIDDTLTHLAGTGTGDFVMAAVIDAGGDAPGSIVVSDVDGDGAGDLLVALGGLDAVAVFLGDGAGGFSLLHHVPGIEHLWSMIGEDFDLDGRLDLVLTSIAGSVAVLPGLGGGSFGAPIDVPCEIPWYAAAPDLDEDGLPDLVVGAFAAVNLYLNTSTPPIVEHPFRRGDVGSDGATDLADPLALLAYLFVAGAAAPPCADAADVNDSGDLGLDDAIQLLNYLFVPGSPPPDMPGPATCGDDPTADALGCEQQESCP